MAQSGEAFVDAIHAASHVPEDLIRSQRIVFQRKNIVLYCLFQRGLIFLPLILVKPDLPAKQFYLAQLYQDGDNSFSPIYLGASSLRDVKLLWNQLLCVLQYTQCLLIFQNIIV